MWGKLNYTLQKKELTHVCSGFSSQDSLRADESELLDPDGRRRWLVAHFRRGGLLRRVLPVPVDAEALPHKHLPGFARQNPVKAGTEQKHRKTKHK